MASEYKKRKLKSKFLDWGTLKNKKDRCKYLLFYTPSERHFLKEELGKELNEVLKEEQGESEN